MLGQELAHYRILEKLGEGAMGEVYRARDTQLKRDVALKILPAGLATEPERLARFEREARTLAALNHPNIVTIHSVEEADGVRFLTMELVEGVALSLRILRGGLPLESFLEIAEPLSEALSVAHEKGIIHRDLKPGNVMVTKDGRVKVLDFGLVKRAGELAGDDAVQATTESLTEDGRILGTVPYMSPEQAEGRRVDHRSDIFSLGVMLYEMATGERPFSGASKAAVLSSILRDTPRPITECRPETPQQLRRTIHQCLEKDPLRRFQSARDVYNSLVTLRRELSQGGASPSQPAATSAPSIAVLPFLNMSAEPGSEYFSDGLAEDVINALTKIKDLRVAARTSAFSFKGASVDVREIGRQLNVRQVLEGSVRRAGKRLRITAQLTDVASGYHLWSEQYDRMDADVFDIQDEITLAIVSALEVELLAPEKDAVTKRHTADVEAYQLYSQGRYHWNKRTPEAFRKAIGLFERAVAKDPGYALAYAGLSDAYALLGDAGHTAIPPKEAFSLAAKAVHRALELDDRLAEAHTSLGHLRMHEFRWSEAERELRRSLELNPNYATTHHWYGFYLVCQGRFERALDSMRRAHELDPVSLAIHMDVGVIHYYAGDYDRAIERYQETLEMDPAFVRVYATLGSTYGMMGRYDEAIAMWERVLELSGDRLKLAGLARVWALAGMAEKASSAIRELRELSADRYVSPYSIALIYASLGDSDPAMAWLDRAWDEGASELIYVKVEPYFKKIHRDPRFVDLLRRVGLDR